MQRHGGIFVKSLVKQAYASIETLRKPLTAFSPPIPFFGAAPGRFRTGFEEKRLATPYRKKSKRMFAAAFRFFRFLRIHQNLLRNC